MALNTRLIGDKQPDGEFLKELTDEFEQAQNVDDLATFVSAAASKAKDHRMSVGIDCRMQQALNAVNCQYNPDEMALLEHNSVYMPITNMKVRAFRSWVADILINSEDRPWTLSPTPIPDLPEEVEDVVIDAFLDEVKSTGFDGSITTRLSQLKSMAKSHLDRVSREAAEKMEVVIADQMTEGGWREEFDRFIDDLGTYPAAVLKGPIVAVSRKMRWKDSNVVAYDQPTYRTMRVAPKDFYPSPDSQDTQTGAFIVEHMRMRAGELLDAANLEGFEEASIRALIAEFALGWSWAGALELSAYETSTDAQEASAELAAPTMPDTGGVYDVLAYHGRIAGRFLAERGVEKLDPDRDYEAEIWVSGGYVISARLNSHPTGRRPFYRTCFDKVPGQFWGRGLPDLLRDTQRVGNATIRALVKNLAFSAGPIGEADVSRMANETDVDEIVPYRLFRTSNDSFAPNQSPALRFHNIPSTAPMLMGVYDAFMKEADDISGIPAYVLGNPQVAGAGRTLGGLSLLMGNAAKGVKRIIGHIDKDVIEQVVEEYAYLNLMYNDAPDIKFDLVAEARGASGLMQRELSQSRAIELLNVLTPYVQAGDPNDPIIPVDGLRVVLRDVIRSLGYRADEITPDPARKRRISEFAVQNSVQGAGAGGQTGLPSPAPGTPAPQLDGRSLA